MNDLDITRRHFETLFGPALQAGLGLINIWSLPNKISKYFSTVDECADYCHKIRDTSDVYYGISLCPSGIPETKRGSEDIVTGLSCLHADLDFHKEGSKKSYPKDAEQALQILSDVGIRPTTNIHSGGGFQSLWVFKGLWQFEETEARYRAKEMSRVWNMTIREICQSYGCTIDSTFDLARVLRVPGTFNHKYGKPRPVEVVEFNDFTYLASELEQFMVIPKFCSRDEGMVLHVGDYKLPDEKETKLPKVVQDLVDSDGKFNWWWEKRRRDMADQSGSSYDFIIANEGAYRGWSEQDIIDGMMAWRIKHNQNPDKLKRRKYVTDTIGRARIGRTATTTVLDIRKKIEDSDEAPDKAIATIAATMPVAEKNRMLGVLSSYVGMEVIRVIQFGKENSLYAIDVRRPSGTVTTIELGDSKVLSNKEQVDNKLYDPGLMLQWSGKKWREDCRMFRYAAELVDVESATEYAMTKSWLQHWFLDMRFNISDDWWTAFEKQIPFVHDGKVWIEINKLRHHMSTRMDVKVNTNELGRKLHGVGFIQENLLIPEPHNIGWNGWSIKKDQLMKLSVVKQCKIEKPDAVDESK